MHQRKLLGAPMTSTCQWIPNVYGHTQCVPRLGARVRCGGTLAQPTFKYAMYWDFGNEPVGISFEGPGVFFRTAVTADNNGEAVEHCVQNIRCSLCTLQTSRDSAIRAPSCRCSVGLSCVSKSSKVRFSSGRAAQAVSASVFDTVTSRQWCGKALVSRHERERVNRKMFED